MTRVLRSSKALVPLVLGVLIGVALTSATAATTASGPNVGWGGFGNTPNENRHSPLTLIDKSNVAGKQKSPQAPCVQALTGSRT